MAKASVLAGATSQSFTVFIQDSSSTVGAGLAGLVFNTSGLIAYYTFTGTNAAATAITLATLAAVNSAYSSGGFKEIDATNMKGMYRLDVPNAALAAAKGRLVTIMLSGATNMAPLALEIELTGWDNQDGVHGGLSCLPNTAVTTNASLLTSGTGTDQLSVTSGRIDVGKALGTAVTLDSNNVLNVSAKYVGGTLQTARDLGASVLLSTGTGTGQLDFTAGVVKANATQWLGGTIPAVNVTGVPLVDLKYTLGTISPATAGSVRADAVTGAVGSVTGAVGSVTGNVGGSVASVTGAVGSVTGNVGGNVVGSVASVTARVTANSDQINGNATAAANVAHTMQAITRGTVGAAASTTSITTSAVTSPSSVGASGQFIGRTMLFDADTATTNLQGQATNITANTTGATPTFTTTALTTAPASGDTFSIV